MNIYKTGVGGLFTKIAEMDPNAPENADIRQDIAVARNLINDPELHPILKKSHFKAPGTATEKTLQRLKTKSPALYHRLNPEYIQPAICSGDELTNKVFRSPANIPKPHPDGFPGH